MTDIEIQSQAMINAAIAQRNASQDALVQMAGELALVEASLTTLQAKITALQNPPLDNLPPNQSITEEPPSV